MHFILKRSADWPHKIIKLGAPKNLARPISWGKSKTGFAYSESGGKGTATRRPWRPWGSLPYPDCIPTPACSLPFASSRPDLHLQSGGEPNSCFPTGVQNLDSVVMQAVTPHQWKASPVLPRGLALTADATSCPLLPVFAPQPPTPVFRPATTFSSDQIRYFFRDGECS